MFKQLTASACAVLALSLPSPGKAALPEGARAPEFTTRGALDGKPFTLRLRDALRRGPVVLYFYPKAFTQGCTLEAHAFAEATDEFKAMGATVIGMSNDDLPTLQRFSTSECRSKFAVAVASPSVIRAYDVHLRLPPEMAAKAGPDMASRSSRTSYVIAPDGRITMAWSNLDYREHVSRTLAAVRALHHRH